MWSDPPGTLRPPPLVSEHLAVLGAPGYLHRTFKKITEAVLHQTSHLRTGGLNPQLP